MADAVLLLPPFYYERAGPAGIRAFLEAALAHARLPVRHVSKQTDIGRSHVCLQLAIRMACSRQAGHGYRHVIPAMEDNGPLADRQPRNVRIHFPKHT